MLVDNTTAWFREHPLYDPEGQPIVVPDWSFPGRGRVQGQLNRAKTVLTRTEKLLHSLPLRGQQAEWSARLEEKRVEVERALGYVELYGLYAECEAIYGVDHLLALADTLDPADREAFGFDPRVIDWPHYITEVHLPSVVEHARVKTTPGKTRTDRAERLRRQVLSPDRHLAAFDLENTLIASNVVESYSWLATRRLDRGERVRFALRTPAESPGCWPSTARTAATSCASSTAATRTRPVAQLDEDAAELLSALDPDEELPGRHPPGPRAPGARPPHGAHHRRARLRRQAARARCSTRSSPPS